MRRGMGARERLDTSLLTRKCSRGARPVSKIVSPDRAGRRESAARGRWEDGRRSGDRANSASRYARTTAAKCDRKPEPARRGPRSGRRGERTLGEHGARAAAARARGRLGTLSLPSLRAPRVRPADGSAGLERASGLPRRERCDREKKTPDHPRRVSERDKDSRSGRGTAREDPTCRFRFSVFFPPLFRPSSLRRSALLVVAPKAAKEKREAGRGTRLSVQVSVWFRNRNSKRSVKLAATNERGYNSIIRYACRGKEGGKGARWGGREIGREKAEETRRQRKRKKV